MLWKIKPSISEEFINQFPEYKLHLLQLLWDRGLKTQAAIDEFFNPDYDEDLHDPFLMLGMKEAVKIILKAIKNQDKILIYGDFDADGVCSTVILQEILEELGANFGGIYLPDRNSEGYGINAAAIKKIASQGIKLIISVDCGISNYNEVALAKTLGMAVVIVDHHEIGAKLPPAEAIVNPFQADDKYPFRELAAAGVVYKLIQALVAKSGKKIKAGWEKWLLDLVGLATVADLVPLLGENRTLVRYGLVVLAQTPRPGLQELMKIARLNPVLERESLKTNLDAYSLGFVLAPRLNAAGRLDSAQVAYDLLTTKNREQARELAKKIDAQNRQRQKMTEEIVAQIEEKIKNQDLEKEYVIVEKGAEWLPGMLGLAAGKIADRYHRPTFIFRQQTPLSRASARSIPTFNLVEGIARCADILESFGGHAGAAGVVLAEGKISLFKEKINAVAKEMLKKEDLMPSLEIDLELAPEDVNWELFDGLERFEPFGQGNKPPKFLVKDLEIKNCRVVGNGSKHLKMDLISEKIIGKTFKAIGFGLAAKNGNAELKIGDKINVVFELLIDEWNGNRELQLKVIDIKKS